MDEFLGVYEGLNIKRGGRVILLFLFLFIYQLAKRFAGISNSRQPRKPLTGGSMKQKKMKNVRWLAVGW